MHDKYKLSPEVMAILSPLAEIEYYQSSFYIQLAALSNKLGFYKAEKYYLQESLEEREHFLKHYEYIQGMGSEFQVPSMSKPETSAKNLYDLTEKALNMEETVTDAYRAAAKKLMELDPISYNHLTYFLNVQVEAVKFYMDACAKLHGLDGKNGELIAEKSVF
jgi:ferritin